MDGLNLLIRCISIGFLIFSFLPDTTTVCLLPFQNCNDITLRFFVVSLGTEITDENKRVLLRISLPMPFIIVLTSTQAPIPPSWSMYLPGETDSLYLRKVVPDKLAIARGRLFLTSRSCHNHGLE